MKVFDLSAIDDAHIAMRAEIIKKLKELRMLIPSGSNILSNDDLKTVLSWINALESFTPSREQSQLNLAKIMRDSNVVWKEYGVKK